MHRLKNLNLFRNFFDPFSVPSLKTCNNFKIYYHEKIWNNHIAHSNNNAGIQPESICGKSRPRKNRKHVVKTNETAKVTIGNDLLSVEESDSALI